MAKNTTPLAVSGEALTIINRFVNSSVLMREDRELSLIASLYARLDNAREDVKESLSSIIVRLEDSLSEDDILTLFNEYYAVVRKCYEDLMSSGIRSMRNVIRIPNTLINLCLQAVDVKPGSKVFLPFAGNAEFALALDNCRCSGFEASSADWALSQIVLDAYEIKADIEHTTSMIPFFDDVLYPSYDYVFTMPPALSSKYAGYLTKSVNSILTHCLKKGGYMCLITPSSATESIHWREFREMLAKECDNYSVGVIALPQMLVPATAIDITLWIIQKEGDNGGKALLVNANDDEFIVVDRDTRRRTLKIDSILESIEKRDTRFSREVPFNKMGDDYRFTPSRYFTDAFLPEVKADEQLVELRSLIEVLGPQRRPMGATTGKIIGMRELSDNYLTPEIDATKLPEGEITGLVPVSSEGILVGFIGDRLKVGVLENMQSGETVFLRREIIRFQIAPNAPVKKEYLLRELMSEYVRKQANSMSSGATIRRLNRDDILSLQILVVPMDRQEQLVFSDGLAGMSAADRERIQSFEKFRKNLHMMKHGLGQTVFNLGNWMKMLGYARKVGNGVVDDNAKIGGLVKVKVADIYDNIEASLKVLNRQITTFDMGDSMRETEFPLADFIDKYIDEHPRPHVRYEFPSQRHRYSENVPRVDVDDSDPNNIKVIEYPGEFIVLKDEAMDLIIFSEEALAIIFDNIISNAVAHGFTDPDKEYIIHIDFEAEGTDFVLSISNNGDPLPAGKDPSDVFVWGKTEGGKEHAGIGGYQIKDLMEHFGGKAEIISTPDEDFTVTYKLTFTKTNLIDFSD